MKKTAMFGLLAMVLTFGFIGMGCPTNDDDPWGGPDSRLVGTWLSSIHSSDYLDLKIEASGKLLTRFPAGDTSAEFIDSGTIKTDGDRFQITNKNHNSAVGTYGFSNSGNTLRLIFDDAVETYTRDTSSN
jgi:hypothetical protein